MCTTISPRLVLTLGCSALLAAAAAPGRVVAQDARIEPIPAPIARPPATRPAAEVPAALQMIERNAEQVFELVRDRRWDRARGPLGSLERGIRQAPMDIAGAADFAAELSGGLRNLEQAIALKDRTVAMRSANEITRTAARMIERYEPAVPVEVRILQFHARQLEADAAASDQAMVDNSVREIRQTWQTLRPRVLARGQVTEARRIDSLLERLERTRTNRDYQRLGRSLQQRSERLAATFGEPPPTREPAGPAGGTVPERPQPGPDLELRENVD